MPGLSEDKFVNQLFGATSATAVLLESLLIALRNSGIANDEAIDSVFAHARAHFQKQTEGGTLKADDALKSALVALESMQSRVTGKRSVV
jgi:hypothetical protein